MSVLSGAPYGYCYVRKSDDEDARFDIVIDQAAVVREMFRRFVENQESMRSLARWLTAEGVPTATGKTRWNRTTVWGMFRNPAYCGRAAFAKTMKIDEQRHATRHVRREGRERTRRPATRVRARDEWIEIPVPAIVSETMFELASRRLQDNKRFAPRRTKYPFLLQGLLVCQDCGYSYYRSTTKPNAGKRYYYYRCPGSDSWRFEQGRVCDNRPVRQDVLDEQVWDHVTTLLADPELVRRELDRRLEELHQQDPETSEQSRLELEHSDTITIQMAQTNAMSLSTTFATNLAASKRTVLKCTNFNWHQRGGRWERIGLDSNYTFDPTMGRNLVLDICVTGNKKCLGGNTGFHTGRRQRLYRFGWAAASGCPPTGTVSSTVDAWSFTRQGKGCQNLKLEMTGSAQLGQSLLIRQTGPIRLGSRCFLVLGARCFNPGFNLSVIGAKDCFVYCDPLFTIPLPSGGFKATVPNDKTLICQHFCTQIYYLNPGYPGGIARTNKGIIIPGNAQ